MLDDSRIAETTRIEFGRPTLCAFTSRCNEGKHPLNVGPLRYGQLPYGNMCCQYRNDALLYVVVTKGLPRGLSKGLPRGLPSRVTTSFALVHGFTFFTKARSSSWPIQRPVSAVTKVLTMQAMLHSLEDIAC